MTVRTTAPARPPFDQRIARRLVRPLVSTGITPNHITAATLALALAAAALFANGTAPAIHWAAGLFVAARFLDHFDGELARLTGKTTRFGYYFDYASGGLGYAALFAGIGVGLRHGPLGLWAVAFGVFAAAVALGVTALNIGLDRAGAAPGGRDAVSYPAAGGIEIEDGIYLLAPLTWFGFLDWFFVVCAVGAGVYGLWTAWRLYRLRRARDGAQSSSP